MARYDGFISYSHAADGKLAPAVQAELHALGRPWYKLRALSVFRDKTSLAADPGLWPSIERALSNSRWFIYLASPLAARSEWVCREVAWWLANHDSSSLLIVLTEGTIGWDRVKNDFDWHVTDSVPAALAGKFSAEPHWVDLRWAKNEENLSLRHSGFRDVILDVAAPLHDRPKDELDGADVRQYRRNRRMAGAAIASLVLLTIGATLAAYLAIQQSRLSSSRELAAHAVAQLDRDPELSVRLALHALERAETAQAQEVLRKALMESRTLYTVRAPTEVSLTRYSPDGRVIALGSGRHFSLVDAATGVVGHVLPGDSALLPCGAFSKDSRLLATCGTDGTVHLWNVAGGESLRSFKAAKTDVTQAQFNPAGDLLVTTHDLTTARTSDQSGKPVLGDDEFARIWKTATGELVAEIKHGGIVTNAEFDPSGRYLVTAGYDAAVKIWDSRRGTAHKALSGHGRHVLAVRFSRDGRALVTVDEELIIRRWNPDTGELVSSGGQRSVPADITDATGRDAWISPGGSRAVIRTPTSIAVYDTAEGRTVYDLRDVPTSIHNAVFSDDERLLALGGEDSTIVVWDLEGNRLIAKLRGQQSGISDMGFSPDGKVLVTGGVDGTARAWDLGRELAQLVVSHRREVTQAVWDKAGRLLASGGEDGEAIVFDTSGHRIATLVAKGRISALSFSADSKRLLVARYDNGGAHIWDLSSGKPIVTLKGTDQPYEVLLGADYSPDERIVIAGVKDRVLRWDAESGKRLSDIPPVGTRTAAKDGELGLIGGTLYGYSRKTGVACIATDVAGVSGVWDVWSGKLLTELRGHLAPVVHAGMSDDGRWIAFWNESDIEIWNLVNGQRQAVIKSAGWTMALEFNPDGSRLATTGGRADPVARIWDIRTGKLLREFRGHANTVEHARFSSDGNLLVTASADNTVKAWFAQTGQLITSFAQHKDMVFDARYNPDGTRILTASGDGTAMILDCSLCIPPDRLRTLLLQRPPRSLTPQERADFLH